MKIPEPKKTAYGYKGQLRLGGESIYVTGVTITEYKKKAQLLKSEYQAGLRRKPCEKTIGEIADAYIRSREAVLSPATIRGYKTVRRSRFQKLFATEYSQIKDWQKYIDYEVNDDIAPKTIKNGWTFICSALNNADLPTPKVKLPAIMPNERAYLNATEIPAFLEAIKGSSAETACLLGLHSLRLSEILGLDYDDIKDGSIRVHSAVVPDENHKLVKKDTTKNASSRREVPIIIPRLSELLPEDGQGPVVTVSSSTIRREISKACAKANLPDVSIHGLRHSFCSLAFSLSISEAITMKLGGWSDIQTMRKIYTHIAEKDMIRAEDKLQKFFQPA